MGRKTYEIRPNCNLQTLVPFLGKYRIHGGPYRLLEGNWSSNLVVIEFPSMKQAQGWYESDALIAMFVSDALAIATVALAPGESSLP